MYFNPSIYAKATNTLVTHKESNKSMSIFPSRDQCHSLEIICHNLLMRHCKRMPWECRYLKLTVHVYKNNCMSEDVVNNSVKIAFTGLI